MQFHWFKLCYTEFSPSFVSINEWLLRLHETLDEGSHQSLVLCLGQTLSAGKYPASFCPNDNLQFEHIHNLMNWHSLTCLSNFIGTVLQQWGRKITLDELLMCSVFFTTALAYSLSSFNTDKCPQTYIAHRVCVSTELYRSHLSAVVSPSNLQTHLKSLRYQQFQLKRH